MPTDTKPSPTVFRKVASTSLGVMTGASMVMMFTGVPLLGTVMQAGVTVAQAGLDFTDKDKSTKSAVTSLLTNLLFTAVSIIPFVGGAAKAALAAREAEAAAALAARGAQGAAAGTKTVKEATAIGKFFAPVGKAFTATGSAIKNVFSPVTNLFKSAWGGVKNGTSALIGKSETLTSGVNKLKGAEASLTQKFEGSVNPDSWFGKAAAWSNKHQFKTQMAAPMVASIGIGAAMGGDEPRAPQLEEETAATIKANTGREWQERVAAQRGNPVKAAADLAHAGARR